MIAQNICIILFFTIVVLGSVYMNFIFPKRVEKEKRQKEEKEINKNWVTMIGI